MLAHFIWLDMPHENCKFLFCRGDEIGKHAALKMLWAQALEGSSPSLGTFLIAKR